MTPVPGTTPSSSWRLFGHWSARTNSWWGIYAHAGPARMHAGDNDHVVALDARQVPPPENAGPGLKDPTDDGVYWAWLPSDRPHPELIYPSRRHFEICFAGGSGAAEALGRGRVITLDIAPAEAL